MKYRPSQPAAICDAALRAAVRDMDEARHRAVLWFADIQKRGLFRELGYSNMSAYASVELKFSKTRTGDFLRLAAKLEELPRVRESLAAGDLGYTKAVEIIKVATPKTEAAWVQKARSTGRRELARKVQQLKNRARQRKAGRIELLPRPDSDAPLPVEVPQELRLTLTPEQWARYETLMEGLGPRSADRVETLLSGLEALVQEEAGGTSSASNSCEEITCAKSTRRRVAGTPFLVHVHQCPDCGRATVPTRRGELALGPAEAARVACDAITRKTGRQAAATISPRVRAEVLARDRHHCQAPGCPHTRFLEVHHVKPKSEGGGNDPANLVTLCAGCHRLHHQRKGGILDRFSISRG